MTDRDAIALAVIYGIGMLLTLGIVLGKKADAGDSSSIGDLIAALVWPAFWLVVVGYQLGSSE